MCIIGGNNFPRLLIFFSFLFPLSCSLSHSILPIFLLLFSHFMTDSHDVQAISCRTTFIWNFKYRVEKVVVHYYSSLPSLRAHTRRSSRLYDELYEYTASIVICINGKYAAIVHILMMYDIHIKPQRWFSSRRTSARVRVRTVTTTK